METERLLAAESTAESEGESMKCAEKPAGKPTVPGVLRKIWLQALTIFMVFFVTLSLFPGVVTIISPDNGKSSGNTSSGGNGGDDSFAPSMPASSGGCAGCSGGNCATCGH